MFWLLYPKIATGKYGANDYSTWKYKLEPRYIVLREGHNKLTAKATCHDIHYDVNKWTSIVLTGSKEDNHRDTTNVTKPSPLGISIKIDKNPITAGDIQTITVKIHGPDTSNSFIRGAKVSGQIIDLSSLSSHSSSESCMAIRQAKFSRNPKNFPGHLGTSNSLMSLS